MKSVAHNGGLIAGLVTGMPRNVLASKGPGIYTCLRVLFSDNLSVLRGRWLQSVENVAGVQSAEMLIVIECVT